MLPLNLIQQEREQILLSLRKRNFHQPETLVNSIIESDEQRRKIKTALDQNLAEANRLAKSIGELIKNKDLQAAETAKSQATELRSQNQKLKDDLSKIEQDLDTLLLQMPNCLRDIVPFGQSADDNQVFQDWPQTLPPITGLTHWELAEKYQLIDFALGAKISGAGFPVYRGPAAKLQRALIAFFLDQAQNAGYLEYQVPHLVNEDSVRGTGQFPDKDGQMYRSELDDLYLIPTAEVPLTNLFRDTLLDEKDLPIKICGYTPCFRREAGSYGAHVRGLNRLHQFDKVEIVRIEKPENSEAALMEMVQHVSHLLHLLELPYRILRLCGGDTGFASALTYDFETYSAAQQRWLEVSSVSTFDVFQATRLKLRFKSQQSKNTITAHTLNGSALALPRIVATLLENNQTPQGIRLPKALQNYFGAEYLCQ